MQLSFSCFLDPASTVSFQNFLLSSNKTLQRQEHWYQYSWRTKEHKDIVVNPSDEETNKNLNSVLFSLSCIFPAKVIVPVYKKGILYLRELQKIRKEGYMRESIVHRAKRFFCSPTEK